MEDELQALRDDDHEGLWPLESGPLLSRVLEGVRTRDDALQRALELEKATLGFYQALQDELRDEPVLGAIIAAEKQHLTTLMNVLSTGVKFRGLGETF